MRDENFVSSRKPADIPAFNNEFMKLLDEQQRREQRQQPADAAGDSSISAGGSSKPQLSEKGSAPAAPPNHESEAFAVAHGESAQSDG